MKSGQDKDKKEVKITEKKKKTLRHITGWVGQELAKMCESSYSSH